MPMIYLMSLHCEEDEVQKTRDQYPVSASEGTVLSYQAVDLRHNGIAAKSHYQKRRTQLGEFSQIMNRKRPDGGVNQGIWEAQSTEEEQGEIDMMSHKYYRAVHENCT